MNEQKFEMLCMGAVEKLRSVSPIDTGNLRYNGIRYEFIDKDTCKIYIDKDTCKIYVDPNIVPYMPYTNEPWVSHKWNGKENPNEGWFQRGVQLIKDFIVNQLGGAVDSVKFI